jgi:hypothetical protein
MGVVSCAPSAHWAIGRKDKSASGPSRHIVLPHGVDRYRENIALVASRRWVNGYTAWSVVIPGRALARTRNPFVHEGCGPMDSGLAASRRPGTTESYFFTVFAGALGGVAGVFFTGLSASASAAVLRSSMNFFTRAALLPRSLSK